MFNFPGSVQRCPTYPFLLGSTTTSKVALPTFFLLSRLAADSKYKFQHHFKGALAPFPSLLLQVCLKFPWMSVGCNRGVAWLSIGRFVQ